MTTIQCSSFSVLAKAKVVSQRSPAASNSIQVLVLEASLGTSKLSSPRHTAKTPSTTDRRRRTLLPVPCCPPLWEAISPRFFQSPTASRMMLWKMPLNGITPSKRSTGTQHAVHYDVMAIYLVPIKFSTSDINSVTTSPDFVNAILDWKNPQDEDCFCWQEFLDLFGSNLDIESNQWMEDLFCKSMEKTPKEEVMSDFD